jgi:hypothetical protein
MARQNAAYTATPGRLPVSLPLDGAAANARQITGSRGPLNTCRAR